MPPYVNTKTNTSTVFPKLQPVGASPNTAISLLSNSNNSDIREIAQALKLLLQRIEAMENALRAFNPDNLKITGEIECLILRVYNQAETQKALNVPAKGTYPVVGGNVTI